MNNDKFVATIQSLADAAAIQLISDYANKVAVWSKSEEAKIAAHSERTKMLNVFQSLFHEGKYVLLQQRETSDYQRKSKRLKITNIDDDMEEIGECKDSDSQYYEIVGGRFVCADAGSSTIDGTFNYRAMESAVSERTLQMQPHNKYSSGIIGDPYNHEYQLRHYLLNMCQYVTKHMQGSTLQNTHDLHKQIELTDMHASHTVSLKRKRQRDAQYVHDGAMQLMCTANDEVDRVTQSSMYIVKPMSCHPCRMVPCSTGATMRTHPSTHPDAVCVCTSDDFYVVKYGVFYSAADDLTIFAVFHTANNEWKKIASYDNKTKYWETETAMDITFWEVPASRHVVIDLLTDTHNATATDTSTDYNRLLYADRTFAKATMQQDQRKPGVVAYFLDQTNNTAISAQESTCKYLSSILIPALNSAADGTTTKFTQDTMQQTIRFAKGLETNDQVGTYPIEPKTLDGVELIPVPEEDVPLYSTSLDIPTIQFVNTIDSTNTFSWFIGGMPTLAMDGLMAAALCAKHAANITIHP